MIFRIATVSILSGCVWLFSGCGERVPPYDPDNPLEKEVSGEKAMSHVEALVGFGPRPAGSEELEQSRSYIESELTTLGWTVRRQEFSGKTPEGTIDFVNLRARFGEEAWNGSVDGLLCSHYDTKFYESFEFVGANDGGSSTGLLIELARVFATRPALAQRIELVFFDGEEAFGPNITPRDGLYGSRHYAKEWLLDPETRPRWGVLLDMVGDADLKIRAGVQIPQASLRELAEAEGEGYTVDLESLLGSIESMSRDLLKTAADLELKSEVGVSPDYIVDDHIPLNVVAGIPTIDLIDFEYEYWHTPADTIDKVRAESLEKSGKVAIHLAEKYLAR